MKNGNAILLIFSTVALLFICLPVVFAKNHHSNGSSQYDRGVNEALDVTLLVGSEWRAEHKSFTWAELHNEVARRLRVTRKEPWNQ
jgi:hypothetical protein